MKKNSLHVNSSTLIILATLYFTFVLNIAFWQFVIQTVTITNFRVALFCLSLFFFISLPLYILFNILLVKRAAKPILIFLLLVCSFTNYVMVNYGVYIDKHMIQNALETNTREALDLVTFSMITWVFFTGVVPSIVLLKTRIVFMPFKKEVVKRVILCTVALALFLCSVGLSFKEYAAFGRNNKHVKSLINIVNFSAGINNNVRRLITKKPPFKILDSNAKKIDEDIVPTVLLFILGETARSANFSLDKYKRETNPLLKQQDIVYFKEMTSCGTATATSVPCIFSHLLRVQFDSNKAKYTQNLLDLLQEGGYRIIWKENDNGCKGVCDRINEFENIAQTNDPEFCNGSYCFDGVLLKRLDEILKNVTRDTVIVMHTIGSHGPTYYQRYPDTFKKFTPTCDTADIQNCTQAQIVNTYDNTILYTDYIVSSAIDILKKYPELEAGLIYVSDHGESLGENNIYLHGTPYRIAPSEQTEIPMVLWMNENMKKYDYIDYECMKKEAGTNTYSHDNLFHSILGLLEIDTTAYDSAFDFFRPCRISGE